MNFDQLLERKLDDVYSRVLKHPENTYLKGQCHACMWLLMALEAERAKSSGELKDYIVGLTAKYELI